MYVSRSKSSLAREGSDSLHSPGWVAALIEKLPEPRLCSFPLMHTSHVASDLSFLGP